MARGVEQDLIKAVRLLRRADHGRWAGAGTVAAALVSEFPDWEVRRCALPTCKKVGTRRRPLKACARCKGAEHEEAHYCCKAHQEEDWPRHFQQHHAAAE